MGFGLKLGITVFGLPLPGLPLLGLTRPEFNLSGLSLSGLILLGLNLVSEPIEGTNTANFDGVVFAFWLGIKDGICIGECDIRTGLNLLVEES